MRPRHPERLKTFSYVGFHRYSLTFCTINRARLFTSASSVDLVLAQISRASRECAFAVPVYCFMPDHLHLLVEGKSDASDGRDFIKRARQYSAFYYSQRYGATPWQRYGYDHVLRDDEKTLVVARYILQNPLRAGLVKRIADYPFVGSLEWPLDALLDWISKG
jgi:putative transposase